MRPGRAAGDRTARPGKYHRRMADTNGSFPERLEEIRARLAWVRDYL
jgi:hypothetical protein